MATDPIPHHIRFFRDRGEPLPPVDAVPLDHMPAMGEEVSIWWNGTMQRAVRISHLEDMRNNPSDYGWGAAHREFEAKASDATDNLAAFRFHNPNPDKSIAMIAWFPREGCANSHLFAPVSNELCTTELP